LRRADRPAFRLDPAPLVKSRKVPVPDGDAYLSRTFTCEAGSRDYNIYVPSHTDGWKRPLIIMLHGCTQTLTITILAAAPREDKSNAQSALDLPFFHLCICADA